MNKSRKHILDLIVNYDVMCDAEKVKFVKVNKPDIVFCSSLKSHSSVQNGKLKNIFDYDSPWRHESPHDIHSKNGINRAKFDIRTPSSFGGVKTNRHTERIALYVLDN